MVEGVHSMELCWYFSLCFEFVLIFVDLLNDLLVMKNRDSRDNRRLTILPESDIWPRRPNFIRDLSQRLVFVTRPMASHHGPTCEGLETGLSPCSSPLARVVND
jgi:hypothetical protein